MFGSMSKANFQLIYDGKALDNNEINPRDLSAALIAINDLIECADRVINHNKTRAEIKIKASFETGCFKINFSSYQSILKKAKDLLNSDGANAIINATTLISLIFRSLVMLIKFLKGQRLDKIIENDGKSFTVYKDGIEDLPIKLDTKDETFI